MDESHLDDHELMNRLVGGEEDAMDELVRRHAPSVRAFLRLALGDAQLAEDLLQNTFLAVYEGRERYRPEGSFRAWLFGIARNQARTARRDRKRHVSLNHASEGPGGALSSFAAAGGPSPPEAAERREAAERLRRSLGELRAEEREVITLKIVHGLAYVEIAHLLKKPESTVKTWAARGLARLRREFAR